ncbi:MAG TPA: hypothetical protein PLF01_05995 [Alphaproteobacteria bacterium]|nr:hypothetical protein [Alphaproteobacteria bacterium]
MQTQDFNAESRAPLYAYQRSPVNERAFLIVKKPETTADPFPVGDYTVLDKEEDIALAEKKVMNLVSLLNGRKRLMDLGHETKSRILYHIVSERDEDNKTKVLFYKLEQQGVSKENALFRLEAEEAKNYA